MKFRLHPFSLLVHPSNLRRIAFRAVEVVEIFGFDNVQSGFVETLLKRNQLVFVNRVVFARVGDETAAPVVNGEGVG